MRLIKLADAYDTLSEPGPAALPKVAARARRALSAAGPDPLLAPAAQHLQALLSRRNA